MRSLLLVATVSLVLLSAAAAGAASFTVDTTADSADAVPGDGACADAGGRCSLRAALDEANALPGADTILVPAGIYATGSRLAIHDDVTVQGADAATTIVDGGGTHALLENDSATAALVGLTMRNGYDVNGPGGVANTGTMTLTRCAVAGNHVGNAVAGIENAGTLTLVETTVSGNVAGNSSGGIDNGGTLTLIASTVSGNRVGNACAGIGNIGTATLVNSTVSGNLASNSGGGICNQQGGTLVLTSSTVTVNGARTAAGIENEDVGSRITIRNSIVSGNTGQDCGDDRQGTLEIHGGNLIGASSNCVFTGVGVIHQDPPDLGPLQANGGPTATHVPNRTSPALDAADPTPPGSGGDACPVTDQRGVPRPQGVRCDIGAVEGSDPACAAVPRGDCRQGPAGWSSLILRPRHVAWRWKHGDGTSADFGDPLTTTSYRLCVYDRPGGTPQLRQSPFVPAGGNCAQRACWSARGSGFGYRDPDLTPNGVRTLTLAAGGLGQEAIKLLAAGLNLGALDLPLAPPVTAQLLASNGQCWDAEYVRVIRRNTPARFAARSGSPGGAFLDDAP